MMCYKDKITVKGIGPFRICHSLIVSSGISNLLILETISVNSFHLKAALRQGSEECWYA